MWILTTLTSFCDDTAYIATYSNVANNTYNQKCKHKDGNDKPSHERTLTMTQQQPTVADWELKLIATNTTMPKTTMNVRQ